MFDWEEGDRYSFEDSERFEEDSLCSWISEPESLCNNWRGWKRQNINNHFYPRNKNQDGVVHSLTELCARTVAAHIPFEVVEQMMPPVPEQLQLLIAFWSFPDCEEDIRLYSCLANGNAEEFNRGDALYKQKSVHDPLQIGFHLSATVHQPNGSKGQFNVAVTFDRGRITTCNCTCSSPASWCSHVVAVCLHRIHQHIQVKLRAPVSESLSRLQRDQLQKFAQYLISELPQQILPTAQRLIDEILSSQNSDINTVSGAPDPTAGGSANEQMAWWLDESNLHDNIHKILVKFCVPSPIVFSDVNYLSSTAPPVASEWASLLRPLRGREPEGMWNLLSIVREMFKRNDRNSIPLLEIITEECLATEKILVWWVNTKVALHVGTSGHGGKNNMNSNSHGSQYACSSLCDEIVILWRLAALNPALSPVEREQLIDQFKTWHMRVLDRVAKSKEAGNTNGGGGGKGKNADVDVFTGFKPACEACLLDWNDYALPGVTYSPNTSRYYCPVMCFRHANTESQSFKLQAAPISAPHPRNPTSHGGSKRPAERRVPISPSTGQVSGLSGRHSSVRHSQRSSSGSSEGFCDNDMARDSDSPTHRSPDQPDSGQVSRQSSREDGAMGMAIAVPHVVGRRGAAEEREKSSPEDAGAESDWSGAGAADHREHQEPSPQRNQQNRGAEYELYMYNAAEAANLVIESNNSTTAATTATPETTAADRVAEVFSTLKNLDDPNDILFARAEGLHAHGHMQEASCLAVQLAQELLSNPPNLMIELPPPPTKAKRKKVNPASHQITCLASATLAKCAFLCTVLAETPEHAHLSFQVALFGLEMARPPASTKPLEVKLANQESDMVVLLKKLPLGGQELAVIRAKAEQMRGGQLKSRGESLLPLMLGSFLFDALVNNGNSKSNGSSGYRQNTDETLGFEAAVAAIGMKANVCEADHPLLCEATRRQRGELALTLLTHYKDDQDRLMRIMDKLLDKEIHQMYKAPSLSAYYVNNAPQQQQQSSISVDNREAVSAGASLGVGPPGVSNSCPPVEGNNVMPPPVSVPVSNASGIVPYTHNMPGPQMVPTPSARPPNQPSPLHHMQPQQNTSQQQTTPSKSQQQQTQPGHQQQRQTTSGVSEVDSALSHLSLSPTSHPMGGARAKDPGPTATSNSEAVCSGENSTTTTTAGWEAEYKVWEEKYAQDKKRKKHKHNTNVLEPTTPTGDTIPVVQHSGWMKPAGPGSDSGSSGNSSDSMVSSSSGDKISKPVESPPLGLPLVRPVQQPTPPEAIPNPRPQPTYGKGMRFKGKRAYPTVPNQPSEASAYFMFELAKTVLNKAGGNSSTSLFTQPSNSQNHRGPHRPLHMCAFQIGLYALGLHNCVSPNWLSRTYSSHVSWITSQAVEIGSPAVAFLIETWEGHLTPQEAASIADRASRGRDAQTVRKAACLALSCLPHAHGLNPNEIQRAIIQCKEQSDAMLENACLAVEGAAKGGGVYPEVLFSVARKWYEIYETRTRHQARQQARHGVQHQHQQMQAPAAFLGGNVGHPELAGAPSPMNPPTPPGVIPTTSQQQIIHPPPQQQQQQPPQPQPNMPTLEPQPQILPPPVSTISMNGAGAGNSLTGVPGYPVANAATSMPYGLPGMAYPLQYNYLTTNVSCLNPQLTMPMYMGPPGVPFNSPGGISQPLLPPPPMPYYPPVTLPSTLAQGGLVGSAGLTVSGIAAAGPGGGLGQPGQLGGPPPSPLTAQQPPLIQGTTPPPQSFYPVAYSSGVGSGSVGGSSSGWGVGGGSQPPLLSWVRAPCPPLAAPPHQQQLPPTPTSQPQQQVMMLQGGQGGVLMPMNVVRGLGSQQGAVHNSGSMHYLLSAYRVGMLALETLARRVHDDRPQAKYARNPPYGEDVKWLLGVAKKLGTQYLHQFCMCSVNSVVSPFILQELSVEAAQYLARHSPALFHQQLRSPILQPLVQKCQQMFIQCSHLKMYYITPTDYDEFISIIRAARSAFQMTPGGMVQFNELLQALRRSKSCKKELWQRITTALQQPAPV